MRWIEKQKCYDIIRTFYSVADLILSVVFGYMLCAIYISSVTLLNVNAASYLSFLIDCADLIIGFPTAFFEAQKGFTGENQSSHLIMTANWTYCRLLEDGRLYF